MGCAFSHTEQIFIIDHRHNTQRKVNNMNSTGMSILGHVRQALAQHSPQVHVTARWLLASSKSENDIVLVGHLKSNGLHRRQRSGSSDVRFIEHRSKMRAVPSPVGENDGWGTKMPNRPSIAAPFDKPRKVSKSQERQQQNTSNSHFGLIDFRKRLERVRKLDRTDGDEEKVPKTDNYSWTSNGANDGNAKEMMPKRAQQQQQQQQVPIEAMIIKHRTVVDEEEATTTTAFDDDFFCDWDTLSAADCCSVQMASFHSRTTPSAGDVCSEASFVLVKKRLKVAWEHHQIVQVRRHSISRRAVATDLSANLLSNNSPMKNTWMPDIAQEDE